MALVSLLSVALSSLSVKQLYYTIFFSFSLYIFIFCPLRWVHNSFHLFDNILYDPFKLVPLTFNIFCKFQLTTGTNKIMFRISASEILIAGDIVIKKSGSKLYCNGESGFYKIADLNRLK